MNRLCEWRPGFKYLELFCRSALNSSRDPMALVVEKEESPMPGIILQNRIDLQCDSLIASKQK